ncbi:MAG: hypothetical protein E7099_02925 [Mediterranea massiliensis]|nr:hypothetical protein [Mediterranea massiliensis]
MKSKWILATLLAFVCISVDAQQNSKDVISDGKMIINVFGNFHSGFGSNNHDRGFELDRSYLGYQCNLPGNLELKAVMDVGQSKNVDDYHRIAYIKNAQLTWKTGNWKLSGGLISTTQFNMQEKFWGYRYIMKSFQDEYKFGSSADLGISASYKFSDWLSADAIVVNGEGYKKVQVNDGLNYGLGLTATLFDALVLRLYGSVNEANSDEMKDSYNLATFIGYADEIFSIGAEYNSYLNGGYVKNANQSGFSVYTSLKLSKGTSLYARADHLTSKDDWNEAKDGTMGMAGFEFKLGKYFNIAPNFRVWKPKADGTSTDYAAFISCRFGL